MVFKFKQFSVLMEDNIFKVGTDATLIGALAQHNNPARILDIGTGTGVITLMIAQRYPTTPIDAIDISKKAIDLAQQNFNNAPFHQLNAICSPVDRFRTKHLYDLIVSNPPYHLEGTTSHNEMKYRSKSQDNLPIHQLIECIENNLSKDGTFWLIAPLEYINSFNEKLDNSDLSPQIIYNIKHNENSRISRQLVSYSRTNNTVKKELSLVLYKQQREFSNEATKVLKDYLLFL